MAEHLPFTDSASNKLAFIFLLNLYLNIKKMKD